jgi:hypothetical protein
MDAIKDPYFLLAESRLRRFQRTSGSTAVKKRGFCRLHLLVGPRVLHRCTTRRQ